LGSYIFSGIQTELSVTLCCRSLDLKRKLILERIYLGEIEEGWVEEKKKGVEENKSTFDPLYNFSC
jgi:hypothetical protein